MREIEFEATDVPTVATGDVFRTRWGTKVELVGDTYDAKESIKSMDWDETHHTWDDEREAWVMDAGEENVEMLREQLESDGFDFGGVSEDACQALVEAAERLDTDDDTYRTWEGIQAQIEVVYEGKRNGKIRSKEGVVTSVQPDNQKVMFRRDDHQTMYVEGGDLYTRTLQYPYVGDVVSVTLTVPEEVEEIDREEIAP